MTTALTFRGAIIITSAAASALISRSEKPTAADIPVLGDEPWRGEFGGESERVTQGWGGGGEWNASGSPFACGVWHSRQR